MADGRPQIFLSFKTEEKAVAKRLKDALVASRFTVWWQEEIQCGKEWHGEIDNAIDQAGCVVVLWSRLANQSRWVCHEASQAIARDVYAPARLEPVEINSPYDRLQAIDLINWSGENSHPGFQSLLKRISELLPTPQTRTERFYQFVRNNLGLLLSLLVAAIAMALFFLQSLNMASQLDKQEELAVQIERTLQPITGVRLSFYISVGDEIQGVSLFKDRLRAELIDPETNALRTILPDGVYTTWEGVNGERTVSIGQDSELWPNENAEWLFYLSALKLDISVRFKKAASFDEFIAVGPESEYDLGFDVGSFDPDGSGEDEERIVILWSVHSDQLEVSFSDTPSARYWSSNGNVVSVPDLEKSLAKFAIMSTTVRNLDSVEEKELLFRNRRLLDISAIWIRYSGKTILLKAPDLTSSREIAGVPTIFIADMSKSVSLMGL